MAAPAIENEASATDGVFSATDEHMQKFSECGYLIVRGLLNKAESAALKDALEFEQKTQAEFYSEKADGEGRRYGHLCWNRPAEDITGYIARSQKVAGTMEKMLQSGEVYHYHSKIISKAPKEGGSLVWHQDYGYWYFNGCLLPNMGTVYIAVDKATKENGCLKVMPRSHQAGRVEHVKVAEQAQADPERVRHLERKYGVLAAELDVGDAVFFHCNVLHRSEKNDSDFRRLGFIVSYNTASNDPVRKHHHPCYTPMEKVRDADILGMADRHDPDKMFYDGGGSEGFSELDNMRTIHV